MYCLCIYIHVLDGKPGEMFGGSVCGPNTLFPDAIPQDFTASLHCCISIINM